MGHLHSPRRAAGGRDRPDQASVPGAAPVVDRAGETADDELRLFPIVAMDVCYPVASLLSRDKLEEAAALVSDRCWVASTPLYG